MQSIDFYRSHIDLFIEEVFRVPLKPFQKVIARAVGVYSDIIIIEARSMGKTWLSALILLALGVLYSYCPIGIVSATVSQALFIVKYIEREFSKYPAIAQEIIFPINVSKTYGIVNLKSGSFIESFALGSGGDNARGRRLKILCCDEARLISSSVFDEVLRPMLQYQRPMAYRFGGFVDFPSKCIQISSAYHKSCDLFRRIISSLDSSDSFLCCLNYLTGVRAGIVDYNFVLREKARIPASIFEYEWNSVFVDNKEGSFFPYSLSSPCRNLEFPELRQPIRTDSFYVLGCDPAVAEDGDNACILIIKVTPNSDGTFLKSLVFIQTFRGLQLDELAFQIRDLIIRFPLISKLVIDVNSWGNGLIPIFDNIFVKDGVEYPPIIPDNDLRRASPSSLPLIRAVIPSNKSNSSMALNLRVCLENRSVSFLKANPFAAEEFRDIFDETDALQFEMANIYPKVSSSNNVIYDRIVPSVKKDRYTCFAMTLDYINEFEEVLRGTGTDCMATVERLAIF